MIVQCLRLAAKILPKIVKEWKIEKRKKNDGKKMKTGKKMRKFKKIKDRRFIDVLFISADMMGSF